MRVLITGNLGYIGPVVSRHLRATLPGLTLFGFDSGFFGHCITTLSGSPEKFVNQQYFGDIRHFPPELLTDIDAIVHLAALSNDPMGNRFDQITIDINYHASVRLAEMALTRGVKHFVFASSCSVYGAAGETPRRETDEVNPLTAYSRSKIETENALRRLACPTMFVTCLRFATACGFSPRLRLDLVLNDFVACALVERRVTVLSDGTPWRPLIDVRDMARAIEWALVRDHAAGGTFVVVNTGADEWNYQVRDLAEAVAAAIPGTTVSIKADAPSDRRSYRVDFSLFRSLAPAHQPSVTLSQSISDLCNGLTAIGFCDRNFRASNLIRLNALERLINAGELDGNLYWTQ